MAWPPPVLPVDRTDALLQQANHPADHNAANQAINDIVAKVVGLLPVGNFPVARKTYRGSVTTDANGDFAVVTGFTPVAAVGVGAQSSFPTLVTNTLLDATQCVFNVRNIPSGAPAASAVIYVSYVIYGPAA